MKKRNAKTETELNQWFIRYFQHLERTRSPFFCENVGILEICARDRNEYQWEDRILENLKIVEGRYPELYTKMSNHLSSWLERVDEDTREKAKVVQFPSTR
jgi:phenylpropionate dioxygenase-like ring-hydroxylating dioxygenase large terminal subunit